MTRTAQTAAVIVVSAVLLALLLPSPAPQPLWHGGAEAFLVDLNEDPAPVLTTLPGIGSSRAQSILEWRSQHGRIPSPEALLAIPGIGPGTVDRIRSRILDPGSDMGVERPLNRR